MHRVTRSLGVTLGSGFEIYKFSSFHVLIARRFAVNVILFINTGVRYSFILMMLTYLCEYF
jgi:hypothetical protein